MKIFFIGFVLVTLYFKDAGVHLSVIALSP